MRPARTREPAPGPVPAAGAVRARRPEVQALRAVAVALVVVHHLVPERLPGGFVGVDVFFVISGFLITAHLLRELEREGRVHLGAFWAARARRILPAAVVTTGVVVGASFLLLPPTRWRDVAEQAVASTLYVQNWLLAAGSVDYLARDAAPSPLQHFWSLAVEEQFYLLWPVLLAAAAALALRWRRTPRSAVLVVAAAVVGLSFAASVVWTGTGSPAAYFVTPTRVWELAAGGLLAVAMHGRRSAVHGVTAALLAWAGLATVAAAAVLLDGDGFPGAQALAPVAGTAAVIAAGRTTAIWSPAPVVDRLVVQRLGDVSYSLYLWHWPVIVLLPEVTGLGPGPLSAGLALASSVVLALACERWVERPFRGRTTSPARQTLVPAAGAMVVVAVLATGPVLVQSSRAQVGQEHAAEVLAGQPLGAEVVPGSGLVAFSGPPGVVVPDPVQPPVVLPREECRAVAEVEEAPVCAFGSERPGATTVALVGDSHAMHLFAPLEAVAADRGWRLLTMLKNSCPFSAERRRIDLQERTCENANEVTLRRLLVRDDVDLVVTSGWRGSDFVEEEDGELAGARGYADYWSQLVDDGKDVVVVADNPDPEEGAHIPECVAQHLADPTRCDLRRSTALARPDPLLRAAALEPRVRLVNLLDRFCDDTTCPAVIGSVMVYRDQNHMTADYARSLAADLADHVPLATG